MLSVARQTNRKEEGKNDHFNPGIHRRIAVYLISKLVMRASPSKLVNEYFSAPRRLGKWILEPSDKVTTNSSGVNSMMI